MPFQLAVVVEENENPRKNNAVDYLPFGVKTIKVEVRGEHRGKLRLRPQRLSINFGEKFSHEDVGDPPQFVVSWGGGHEDYYELDYPKKRLVHFLARHVGSTLVDYVLTIVAEDPKTGEQASLPVRLTAPREGGEVWGQDEVYRPYWQVKVPGLQGVSDVTLRGVYTPRYITRWWPQNKVVYDYKKQTPRVRLHFERLVSDENGRIQVYAAMPDENTEMLLAVISGSIAYPLYDMRQMVPELYRLGNQTWVLRVWFFWLDLELDAADLNQYQGLTATELTQALQGVKRWKDLHEIPDAERVDILFNDDLEVLYAATDLHWRELWGRFTLDNGDDPLEVQISNTRLPALARDRENTWEIIKGWSTILLNQILDRNEPPYKPHEEVVAELAGAGKLAARPGALETHSPAFLNIEIQRRFTSTDVTDG